MLNENERVLQVVMRGGIEVHTEHGRRKILEAEEKLVRRDRMRPSVFDLQCLS